jgi:hypothetical protein
MPRVKIQKVRKACRVSINKLLNEKAAMFVTQSKASFKLNPRTTLVQPRKVGNKQV